MIVYSMVEVYQITLHILTHEWNSSVKRYGRGWVDNLALPHSWMTEYAESLEDNFAFSHS